MTGSVLWLALSVAIPVFGAPLVVLFGSHNHAHARKIAVVLGLATLFSVLKLLLLDAGAGPAELVLPLPMGLDFHLLADHLAVFMALASSSISFIIILYSLGYIAHYKHQSEYFMMVILFLGGMMGLVFSASLVWMFVFWEITALCSWRLVGFFRGERELLKASKTFMITVFGALCMLLGIVAIYAGTGSVDMVALRGQLLQGYAVVFILLGIFSKSATLPLSTWLPDAGVAPSPVTALLHAAVLVKIGVYAYARLFLVTFQMGPEWNTIIALVAGVSALVSAGAALTETDIKRIIAYSTISQIGFIFLGLATGNFMGTAGALLYILMHGVAKAGLFLCAGIIEHKTHTKDITKMGGLLRVMPVTAVAFAFCAFSVMGIPPFGGFWSKYMVFAGSAAFGDPLITGMFLLGAILTVIYLLRVFYAVFLGEGKEYAHGEGHGSMVGSVAVLGFASLLLGIFINYPSAFVERVCRQIASW